MIGTLAVDGWAVTFGTAKRGLVGLVGGHRSCGMKAVVVSLRSGTTRVPGLPGQCPVGR